MPKRRENPWPSGYAMDGEGLWHGPQGSGKWLSDPFKVVASGRSVTGGEWSRLIEFTAPDQKPRMLLLPCAKLASTQTELRARLGAAGFKFNTQPSAFANLCTAILKAKVDKQILTVDAIGWAGDDIFVLPHRPIARDPGVSVHYAGSAESPSFGAGGSEQAWVEGVAAAAVGNPLAAFALSAALSGPLLRMTGCEGGGFHFRGASSSGKSTLLLIAGSVWGGGGSNGNVQSWRATGNGLEGAARDYSDTFLALDELEMVSPDAIGDIVYLLANGGGKGRASVTGASIQRATWRLIFMSSGEIGLADHMRNARTKGRPRAGQELRLAEIDVDAGAVHGVWEDLHDACSGAAFSDQLKACAKANYGSAGPAFVERLLRDPEAEARVNSLMVEFRKLVSNPEDTGQVGRVLERFALVAAAGELAIEFGILPWEPGSALMAVQTIFDRWAGQFGRSAPREARSTIEGVGEFLQRYAARFAPLPTSKEAHELLRIPDLCGYRTDDAEEVQWFLFNDPGFREAIGGASPDQAAHHLEEAGFLKLGDSRHLKRKAGKGPWVNQRFYWVSSRILDG